MANRVVATVIYCKLEGEGQKGWQRFKPVVGDNHQLRPGFAWVNGEKVKFETFTYQHRTYVGSKPVYKTVGTDAAYAYSQAKTLENRRRKGSDAKGAGVQVIEDKDRRTVKVAAEQFVERTKNRGKPVFARRYELSLERFQESAPLIQYVDEITENSVLNFHAHLRSKYDLDDSSVANAHRDIKSLLLWCGYAGGSQMKQMIGKVPDYDREKIVAAYGPEELEKLFEAIPSIKRTGNGSQWDAQYFRAVIKILLMLGLRFQEATHLAWTDIDFKRGEVTVRMKRDLGFRTKNRRERLIPLPPELADILRERRKLVPAARLVVGTHADKPATEWLAYLKLVAHEAGIECGHCDWCHKHPHAGMTRLHSERYSGCARWTIHNFRKTYATTLWRTGKFLLTEIRDLLGHADIKTTMIYLAGERSEDTKQKMRDVVWC